MPFCEGCSRYWTPSSMREDGACPTCGKDVPHVAITSDSLDLRRLARGDGEDDVSAPWHFKLLVTALVVYLAWRIVDLFM